MISKTLATLRTYLSMCLLLALATTSVQTAVGQDTENPGPVLPNLAPREVEIRGQLVIQFPALERQPLIGFNPPPRIPIVPSDRRPVVEEYKQGRADLPESTIDRPSPPGSLLSGTAYLRGELEAAGGSYFDRLIRGRFDTDLSAAAVGILRFDYFGSDGSLIGITSGTEVRNPHDSFSGLLGVSSRSQSLRYGVSLSGLNDTYTLFGLTTSDDSLAVEAPGRRVNGLSADFSLGTTGSGGFGSQTTFSMGASGVRSDPEVDSLALSSSRVVDRRLEINSVNRFVVGASDLVVDLNGGLARLSADRPLSGIDSTTNQSQLFYNSGLRIEKMGRRYSASIGLNVIGTGVDFDLDADGPKRELVYLTPILNFDLHLAKGLTFFLRNRPEVLTNGVSEFFRSNPYAVSIPSLQPSLMVVQSDFGASISLEPLQVQVSVGFDQSPNWKYFDSAPGDQLDGYFNPLYEKARVFRGTIKAEIDLTSRLHGSLAASYRQSDLTDLDANIPYFPDWTGSGSIQYRFLKQKALVQLDARFRGERYIDVANTTKLDPTIGFDATLLFNVSRSIGITVRGRNLLGNRLEFWDGFPQIDRQILGGFRLLW